jgi:tetratricopeptide (TPR) repeat protein
VHEARSEAGAQMAAEALSTEPNNERAMLALARHELGLKRYSQAQESLQHLSEFENLSGAGHRELGALLSTLLRFKDEGMPGTAAVDSKATRAAARTHFERAMALVPEDPRAAYQLGWLACGQGDVAETRELLPTVEAAFYRRPESVELAELLVRMHSILGNPAEVFKYAVAEQRLAATEAERARATARVERLRAQIKTAQ